MKKLYLFFAFWLLLSALIFSSRVCSADLNEKNWAILSTILHAKAPYNAHDRQQLYEVLHWSKDCEENFRANGSSDEKNIGINKYSLGKAQFLLEIGCGLHAYQGSFTYYFIDFEQKKLNLVGFKTIDIGENNKLIIDKTSGIAGEPMFKDGKLTIFTRARGAGGCGSKITYGFKNGESYIIEARARSCEEPMDKAGKFADPENWPVVYRNK